MGSHVGIEAARRPPSRAIPSPGQGRSGPSALAFMAAIGWFGLEQAQLQYGYGDVSQTIAIPMLYYWVPLLVGGRPLGGRDRFLLAAQFLIQAATGTDPLEPGARP